MTQNKFDQNYKPKRSFRIKYALLVTFILTLILDIGLFIYFKQPNLVLRNEGNVTNAMDYLFEQMERDDSKIKIAWQGASVMQGLHNTPPDKTYPALISKFLKNKGINATSYNLAVAGNSIGDNYLLIYKSIKCNANIIPVALHYKLFSKNRQWGSMVSYKENAYYLARHPEFGSIRSDMLKIEPFEWTEIMVDRSIAKIWSLYRYRKTIWIKALESGREPLDYFGFQYAVKSGLVHNATQIGVKLDYNSRNQDNIWKEIPPSLAKLNRLAYKNIDLSESNKIWAIIDKMCEEADKAGVILLFFYSPVNFEAVKYFNQYDFEDYRKFKVICAKKIGGNGHMVLDMSNKVESKYFTDFEHFNMNGHRQLAVEMIKQMGRAIVKARKGGRVKSIK